MASRRRSPVPRNSATWSCPCGRRPGPEPRGWPAQPSMSVSAGLGRLTRSAELGEPFPEILAVHRRGDIHVGIKLPEEWLREDRDVRRVRKIEDHEGRPEPV